MTDTKKELSLEEIVKQVQKEYPLWEKIEHDDKAVKDNGNSWRSPCGQYRIESAGAYGAPRPEDGEIWYVSILTSGEGLFLPFAYQVKYDNEGNSFFVVDAVSNIVNSSIGVGVTKYFSSLSGIAQCSSTKINNKKDAEEYFNIFSNAIGWQNIYPEGHKLYRKGNVISDKSVVWNSVLSNHVSKNPYCVLAGLEV